MLTHHETNLLPFSLGQYAAYSNLYALNTDLNPNKSEPKSFGFAAEVKKTHCEKVERQFIGFFG